MLFGRRANRIRHNNVARNRQKPEFGEGDIRPAFQNFLNLLRRYSEPFSDNVNGIARLFLIHADRVEKFLLGAQIVVCRPPRMVPLDFCGSLLLFDRHGYSSVLHTTTHL
jgi:hypothetical protein